MSREFNIVMSKTHPWSSVIGKPEPVAHPQNCKTECPYGKDRAFCFPCMAKIMSEHNARKKGATMKANTKEPENGI